MLPQEKEQKLHYGKKITASDFDEAVKIGNALYDLKAKPFTRDNFMSDEDYENRRSNWKIWGCALFDNETDARKSFG